MHSTISVIRHRITLMELCRCTNFHVACSKYLEVRGLPTCTCVARAQCTTRPQVMYQRIALVKRFQCTKFRSLAQSFPKVKVPMHMHSARSMHVHYVPHHQMTYNIELFSLKSISVPNLVSIAQIFLEPADPCQINSSGPGTRRLHPTETVTTETHRLWQHTCDLHVWHLRCPPFGL